MTRRLRTGRPLRKRRRRPDQQRSRFIAPVILIDHRSPAAGLRRRIGDWEGDLITGRMNQSAIGTLADRASRYVRLIHLPACHDAEAVRDGLLATLSTHTAADLQAVEEHLNNRPRKKRGWRTPAEIFTAALTS